MHQQQVSGLFFSCINSPLYLKIILLQALVVDKYLTNPKGDLVSGPNRVVNFVRCLAQSSLGSELTKLEVCSRDFLQIDDYRTFIEFIRMNSEEVKTVFENMRTKTASLLGEGNTLPRVPTVTVNGQMDYNALDDLVQEACNQTTWIVSEIDFYLYNFNFELFSLLSRDPNRAFAQKLMSSFFTKL